MAHPAGGLGNTFETRHPFGQACAFVGTDGLRFSSTTGEQITAKQGLAEDGKTHTIVFNGERNRHGSACKACWGFRQACTQSRIGQCVEALDSLIT